MEVFKNLTDRINRPTTERVKEKFHSYGHFIPEGQFWREFFRWTDRRMLNRAGIALILNTPLHIKQYYTDKYEHVQLCNFRQNMTNTQTHTHMQNGEKVEDRKLFWQKTRENSEFPVKNRGPPPPLRKGRVKKGKEDGLLGGILDEWRWIWLIFAPRKLFSISCMPSDLCILLLGRFILTKFKSMTFRPYDLLCSILYVSVRYCHKYNARPAT